MEAKDSKGNIIKAGDTVKVLRVWALEEHDLPVTTTHKGMIGQSFEITVLTPDKGTAKVDSMWTPLCVLEKVQATPETFKVLITGATRTYWYKHKIGDIFEVKEADKDDYLAIEPNNFISKSDCHVIEPVWKVMKDSEEQKRAVEYWGIDKKWHTKRDSCWADGIIYRLAPEPKQPEYVEYSYEDREKLRGLWVRRKSDGTEFMVVGIEPIYLRTVHATLLYKTFFDNYETLGGQPVGKLKTT